jgi:NAD/NADP transhydrogenase alpha subunit
MSGANSIHGVVLVGVILVAASSNTLLGHILVFFAALLGTLNVVGGYVVTDRMLEMFKVKQNAPDNLDYSADLGAPVSLEIHESRAIAASDIVPEDELVQVTQASATQAKIVEVVEE